LQIEKEKKEGTAEKGKRRRSKGLKKKNKRMRVTS